MNQNPRIEHRDFGAGRIEAVTHNLDGEVLCFIRWLDTNCYGVAGGWYALDRWDPHHYTVDGAKLAAMFRLSVN